MTEPSARRRLLILAICCLSLLMVGMDNTIVNVALPSIRDDLGASVSGLQWTIDAYTVVIASLLILAGSTADRVGRRRIFQIGLATFTAGSLLCSIAPSLGWLIVFRMVQAAGGSMLNPVAMSIITNVFTEPRERARAIGAWGAVVGVSMGLGPVVGGVLVESIGWRAIFWINVPIGVLAFVLAARFVPESKADRPRRPDLVGQILLIVLLGSVTYAIIDAPKAGWSAPTVAGLLGLGVLTLGAFIGYERRRRDPLIDLRFFASVPFAGASICAVCLFLSFAGFLFLNVLYLQDVRGFSPLQAGLVLVPMSATTIVFSPLSGRIVGSRGARLPLTLAGVALAGGAALLATVTRGTPLIAVIGCMVVFGFGFAIANAPITNTAVSGMPRQQAGVAAAVASTSRQVGTALGVAIIGAMLNSASGSVISDQYLDAAPAVWTLIAALGLVIAVLGVVTTGPRAQATAERVAATFDSATQANAEETVRAVR